MLGGINLYHMSVEWRVSTNRPQTNKTWAEIQHCCHTDRYHQVETGTSTAAEMNASRFGRREPESITITPDLDLLDGQLKLPLNHRSAAGAEPYGKIITKKRPANRGRQHAVDVVDHYGKESHSKYTALWIPCT